MWLFWGQMSLMNNLKLHFMWEFIVFVGRIEWRLGLTTCSLFGLLCEFVETRSGCSTNYWIDVYLRYWACLVAYSQQLGKRWWLYSLSLCMSVPHKNYRKCLNLRKAFHFVFLWCFVIYGISFHWFLCLLHIVFVLMCG